MSNLLVSSIEEVQQIENLLAKNLPSYRKAYSDRTAWLMAFLSELVYIRFNPIFKNKAKVELIELIETFSKKQDFSSFSKLINAFDYEPESEKQKLVENCEFLNLNLIRTYDQNETQAMLLENTGNLFLAFRGTEPKRIKDIKTDLNAVIKQCNSGGKIHTGFDKAFAEVALDIQKTLNQKAYKNKPLYITGHSLGGALATIAAKKLTHAGGIAACYTYGSPRVGDTEWIANIKTPIYRIVNAHDPVTLVPPSGTPIRITASLLGWLPWFGPTIEKRLMNRFGGYEHCGNMRYLSDCLPGKFEDVKLLYSVSFMYRVLALFANKKGASKIPSDHSISIYKDKLKIIAMRRNGLI